MVNPPEEVEDGCLFRRESRAEGKGGGQAVLPPEHRSLSLSSQDFTPPSSSLELISLETIPVYLVHPSICALILS
jgi:hypothetical protein